MAWHFQWRNTIMFVIILMPVMTQAFFLESFVALGSVFYCRVKECCSGEWITPDLSALQWAIRSRLHGQHLVSGKLVSVLQSHVNNPNPAKPLIISFHGSPGIGKTFTSNLIAKHFFKNGIGSNFYHRFHATLDFPPYGDGEQRKRFLINKVKDAVSLCERSLIVFEDVDLYAAGLLDAIQPFLDYNEKVDGVDFRKSVFILLNNSGEERITQIAYSMEKRGKPRESITMSETQEGIAQDAYGEKGGLQGSSLIEKNLIDCYIPFLPLERQHVEQCVKDALQRRDVFASDKVEFIAKQMRYMEEYDGLYSKTGCRGVDKAIMEAGWKGEKHPPSQKLRITTT